MHINYHIILISLLFLFTKTANSQSLVHYWNFNDNSSIPAILTPSSSLVSGAAISAIPGGSSVVDPAGGTGQGFDVQNLNARNGDASGTHLRFNNPIGGVLVFSLPTTGFSDVTVKFTTRRSGSGAGAQTWEYSTDGTNFSFFATVNPMDGNPVLQTFDFSSLTATDDNPNFKLRVSFAQGGGSTGGNNRFDNFTLDGVSSGVDTNPPVVTFTPANNAVNVPNSVIPKIYFNEPVRLIDNSPLTSANVASVVELRVGNQSGPTVPFTANVIQDSIFLIPVSGLSNGTAYFVALLGGMVEDLNDNAIASTQSAIFNTANTSIGWAETFVVVEENVGSRNLQILFANPGNCTFDVELLGAPHSTADGTDIGFATQTLTFSASTASPFVLNIPVIDDATEEQHAEYFVLRLSNAVGCTVQGDNFMTFYIRDNDRVAKTPTKALELTHVASFDPSGAGTSTTEVVAYDKFSKKLFSTSAISNVLDIIDFSTPSAPSTLQSIDMTPYGGVTSVAFSNGLVAVASPNANEQLDGTVVFFDTLGNFLAQVTVGALPDMITFSPDGSKVLVANEGTPDNNYTIDPEGSVSMIDLSGGIANLTQSNVTQILFTAFNAQEAALLAAGLRKTFAGSTLSQDLEPEFITISPDNTTAWVTLQENNGVAEIDLVAGVVADIWPLGTKSVSDFGNGYDVSDNNAQVLIANWPIESYLIPDAIAHFNIGGTNYLITANEGDEKEFANLNERTTVGASSYLLDTVAFPNAAMLKKSHNLGRLRVTNLNGDTDGDGDFDKILTVGSRSFSIFNADAQMRVYDSGDDFELFTAQSPIWGTLFNADNENNTLKSRSRAKGPEPEGIALAQISGRYFAFIALERVGGVMVYEVTNPTAPKFVDYINTRTIGVLGGDLGAETLTFIKPQDSPDGKAYVIVANEISGTLGIFEASGSIFDDTCGDVLTGITAVVSSNTSVRISWDVTPNAHRHRLLYRVKGTPTWSSSTVGAFPRNSINLTGLSPNTTYEFQVRQECHPSTGIVGSYSSVQEFIIDPAVPCGTPINTSYIYNPTNATTVTLSCDLSPFAVNNKYQVRWRKTTDQTMLSKTRRTPRYVLTGLEPNTEYVYQFRVFCSSGWSGFSLLDTFTTFNPLALPRTEHQSDAALVTESESLIQLYPNPSTDFVEVLLPESHFMAQYQVFNVHGQVVLENQSLDSEYFQLDIRSLVTGTYVLKVYSSDGSEISHHRFVKINK